MRSAAWRIAKAKYADVAFTGEGAARVGGRWSSTGRRVVYTSESLALAALELLVHINPPVHLDWVAVRCEFDESLVERIDPTELPADWRKHPPTRPTQAIGDEWIRSGRSAVLAVPSAIVPRETNFLLNPAHPDFARISVEKAEPFIYDSRLLA